MNLNKITKYIHIVLILCFIGLGIKTGLFFGNIKLYTFIYFTNQSNILVLYFIFLIIQANIVNFIPNQNTRYPYNFIVTDLIGCLKAIRNASLLLIFYNFNHKCEGYKWN